MPDELTAELTQRYGFNNAFSSLEQPMEGDYVQLLKAELPILLPKLTILYGCMYLSDTSEMNVLVSGIIFASVQNKC